MSTAIVKTPAALPVESFSFQRHPGATTHVSRDSVAVRVAITLLEATDDYYNFPILDVGNPLDLDYLLVATRIRKNLEIREADEVIFLAYQSSNPVEARRLATLCSRAFIDLTIPPPSVSGGLTSLREESVALSLEAGLLDSLNFSTGKETSEVSAFASSMHDSQISAERDSRYTIIQQAALPLTPVNRPLEVNILCVLLLFGLVGVGASVSYKVFQPFVRQNEDVQRIFSGWIGNLPEFRKRLSRKSTSRTRPEMWEMYPTSKARSHPLSDLLESVDKKSVTRRILVTSPSSRAGTTTVSWNLAVLYARLGRSTLLIEVDSASGPLATIVSPEPSSGLLDVLWGSKSPLTTICETGRQNLSLLASGTVPEGIIPVQQEWQRLMSFYERHYETIIIDVPSSVSESECKIYADWACASVLVSLARRTRKKALARCLSLLDGTRRFVLVNRMSDKKESAPDLNAGEWYLASGRRKVGGKSREKADATAVRESLDPASPEKRGEGDGASVDVHERLEAILAEYRPQIPNE